MITLVNEFTAAAVAAFAVTDDEEDEAGADEFCTPANDARDELIVFALLAPSPAAAAATTAAIVLKSSPFTNCAAAAADVPGAGVVASEVTGLTMLGNPKVDCVG